MTNHSIERTIERAGLPRRAAIKMIQKALVCGKTSAEMPAEERKYMEYKSYDNCSVRYYSGFCFIYNINGSCVTMYKAPGWFEKRSKFHGKIKIRNPHKYVRYNSDWLALEA